MKLKLILICIPALFLQTILAQKKLFEKIEKGDHEYVASFLKDPIKKEELFMSRVGNLNDSSVSFRFSVIEWSAVTNCNMCLYQFLNKKKKLAEDLNVQDEINKCVAHAAKNNSASMLKDLLKNGADINYACESCHKQNPIQIALNYNNYNMFFTLLKAGAKTNTENFYNRNLLHTVMESFDEARVHYDIEGLKDKKTVEIAKIIIDTLIARKVDINKKDNDGLTPLMYASALNEPALYDHVRSKCNKAKITDTKEIVCLLNKSMEYTEHKSQSSYYRGPFSKILSEENIKLNKTLIETEDLSGFNMVFKAVAEDNISVLNQLLTHSPNVNSIKMSNGFSLRPIHGAIIKGNAEIASKLLDSGAEVNSDIISKAKKTFKKDKVLLAKFESAPKFE